MFKLFKSGYIFRIDGLVGELFGVLGHVVEFFGAVGVTLIGKVLFAQRCSNIVDK